MTGPQLHPVLGAGHPPAVRREPVRRRAGHHAGGGPRVDAEVVPVDQEDRVVQAQAPRGVLGLVRRAGREPALALEHEDLYLARVRQAKRQRLPGGGRHSVSRGPGVELQEQRPPFHLGVPRQRAVPPELQQPLPGQRPAPIVRKLEGSRPGQRVPRAHRLVQHCQRRIHQGHRVARGQHEPVAEPAPGPQQVPAHRPGQQQRDQHVHLGPGSAGVPALAVVQRQVDALVDQVLDHLIPGEISLRGGEQPPRVRPQACPVGYAHTSMCSFVTLSARMSQSGSLAGQRACAGCPARRRAGYQDFVRWRARTAFAGQRGRDVSVDVSRSAARREPDRASTLSVSASRLLSTS